MKNNNNRLLFQSKSTFLNMIRARHVALVIVLFCIISQSAVSFAQEWTYTTRPGDNLWNISKNYLKSVNYWTRLQKHNAINVAKDLAPGSKLLIPISWLKIVPSPALTISISGKVDYKAKNVQKVLPLVTGQKISIGDTVITNNDASAMIQFADKSTLLIQKNSEIKFDTLSSYSRTGMVDTRVRLQKGRVETSVTPAKGPASRYQITTPAAVAAVRGTKFRVGFQAESALMANEVTEGAVSVAGSGVKQAIPEGFGTVTEVGKPPSPPKKLLLAPDLSKLTTKIRRLPYTMEWPVVTNAKAYRIQISSDNDNSALIVDSKSDTATIKLDDLKDGKYLLKVRGIDDLTLEGFNANHSFDVNTSFPIPKLSNTGQYNLFYNEKLILRWNSAQKITKYRFQLSKQADFQHVVQDLQLDQIEFKIENILNPGNYFWRVAAIDKEGNEGHFSELGNIVVKPLPEPPIIELDMHNEKDIDKPLFFKWQAVEHSNQYNIQIATDPKFSNIITEKIIKDTTIRVNAPKLPRDYYYRIRSIVNNSVQGSFSKPKQFTITKEEEGPNVKLLWFFLLPFAL